MDERPRDRVEPPEPPASGPGEPVPTDDPGSLPPTPAPLPWERPAAPAEPAAAPRSTIISADPVLSRDDARPEVEWAAPPPAVRAEVPGAPGFVFGSVLARFAAWWIDGFFLVSVAAVLTGVAAAFLAIDSQRDVDALSAIFYVVLTALTLVYFVGFWTSSWHTTPGMRIFGLRIARAADGGPLSVSQSLRRWVALGYPLGVLVLVPAVATVSSLVSVVLPFVLLITTVASPTNQGLHDRVAGSVVVRPAGKGTGGLATACLVVVIAVVLVSVLAGFALIYLGGQISEILREAGQSV